MAFKEVTGNIQFDFQINRVLTYGKHACDEQEVIAAAKTINGFSTWFEAWHQLGEKAENEGRFLHAGFYFRLAEFFLTEKDARKNSLYYRCINNFRKIIVQDPSVDEVFVPYGGTEMKVLIGSPVKQKDTLILFGGYDSFIEEFYLAIQDFMAEGYKVILFEGPGQGLSLKKGLSFEYQWELPLGAILDYFQLNEATVIGISWGGYLALRAAAFEKRVKYVVAYDILCDGFDCMTKPFPLGMRWLFYFLFKIKQKYMINMLARFLMKKNIVADWAITHGKYITGAKHAYDFYQSLKKHSLKGITNKIQSHVLLLAGEKDHYIPLEHYHRLMKEITVAKSLEGRIFTTEEGGQHHCQIGNHKLAINKILEWLTNKKEEEHRTRTA